MDESSLSDFMEYLTEDLYESLMETDETDWDLTFPENFTDFN